MRQLYNQKSFSGCEEMKNFFILELLLYKYAQKRNNVSSDDWNKPAVKFIDRTVHCYCLFWNPSMSSFINALKSTRWPVGLLPLIFLGFLWTVKLKLSALIFMNNFGIHAWISAVYIGSCHFILKYNCLEWPLEMTNPDSNVCPFRMKVSKEK